MAIDLNSNVVRADDMMSAPVDEDIVILNMPKNNYVSLDQIGRRIWELLEVEIPVSALCSRLEEEFAGERQQIENDVVAFLQELESEGLVSVKSR